MSALVQLSPSSQAALTACVNEHMNSSSAWMTKYAAVFTADKAITHAHALAVGLKGTTKAGEAFGGYILSVCPKIDVDTLSALFLGANYHRIKVSPDLVAMEAELKRVSDLVEKEAKDKANAENLDGTSTIAAFDSAVITLKKIRKVPMVKSVKADNLLLEFAELYKAVVEQYLGDVTSQESEKELSTK